MKHPLRSVLSIGLLLLFLASDLLNVQTIEASEFGITTPGSTSYPAGGMQKISKTIFEGASNFISSAKDEAGGYIYMATDTSPASVIKVRASDFQQVGAVELLPGEDFGNSTRIDPANDMGYIGLDIAPAKVVRFRLSTMERIDSITFSAGENNIVWGNIDTTRGYAYYSVNTVPAHIVRVNLSTFTQDGVFAFDTGESSPSGEKIDPVHNILYVGLRVSNHIVRIDLNTFTRMTNLPDITIPSGQGSFSNSTFDDAYDYLYMGTNNNPGRIHKIHVASGDFTLEETFTLNTGETGLPSLMWGQATSSLYAVISSDPAKVIQVNVAGSPGPGSMSRGSTLTLNTGEDTGYAGQIDSSGFLYIGTYNSPSEIVKVQTVPTLARISAINMTPNQDDLHDSAMEPDGSIGYYLTSDQPGRVTKVDLATMTWQGAITLPLDNSAVPHVPDVATNGILLDHIHHKLYVSVDSWTANDYIEVIDTTTFTIVNRIVLANGSMDFAASVMDSAGNYAYFGTCNSGSPKVFKFDINPASGTYLQVVGSVVTVDTTSGSTNRCLRSMVIDETNSPGYVYAGQRTSGTPSGQIHKVRITDMVKTATLTLPTGYDRVNSLAIDTANQILYASTNVVPSKIAKVALSTFTLADTLTLNSGETNSYAIGYDPATHHLYITTYGTPDSKVVRVDTTTFTRDGVTSMAGTDTDFFRANFDFTRGIGYFASDSFPAALLKMSLSDKKKPFMTKVTLTEAATTVNSLRFYSHAAVGNVRLALYSTAGALLWESPEIVNTVSNGWIRVPVTDGAPTSLSLSAGDYYLAFQTNTDTPVASYVSGASNTGEFSIVPYGPFPMNFTTLYNRVSTSDNYVMSAVYNKSITVTQTGGSTDITEGLNSDSYSVVLNSAPSADVTVNFSAAGGVQTTPASPLTFTTGNWNVPQTVTVHIPNDNVSGVSRTALITQTVSSSDVDYNAVTLANITVNITESGLSGTSNLSNSISGRSNVQYQFTVSSTTPITDGQKIRFTFPNTYSLAAITDADISAAGTNLVSTAETVNTGARTFTSTLTTSADITTPLTFTVGDGAAGGLNDLINPTNAGNSLITVELLSNTDTQIKSLNFAVSLSGGTDIYAVVTEALVLQINNGTIALTADPSVNNGEDTNDYTVLNVASNALSGYKIYGKLDDGSGNARLSFGSNHIASGTGENSLGFIATNAAYSSGYSVSADTALSNSSTMLHSNGSDIGYPNTTNNQNHTIYYDLNVDYTTPAGTYAGTITYTAIGTF